MPHWQMVFTEQDQPLLSGSDDELEDFIDCYRCLVVDWRGSEEELLEDLGKFLPEGELNHTLDYPGENVQVKVQFRGRQDQMIYPLQPQNQFRVLLRVATLISPDFEVWMFRSSMDSDTQCFLVRTEAWWAAYREQDQEQFERIFAPVSELNRMWKLGM